jgi:GNAT superfamily N-acetyltransferase
MSEQVDLRTERSIREMQEQAEREFERLRTYAWRGNHSSLRGIEWPINQRGDHLIVSELRPPREILADERHAYTNDHFLLRTVRADRETGLASATIQIERDNDAHVIRNRTKIHEMTVHPQFRGEGLGDALIGQIELQARRYGSTEIYGAFDPQGDPERVRAFYRRNGFAFRHTPESEQVYKILATPDNELPEQRA